MRFLLSMLVCLLLAVPQLTYAKEEKLSCSEHITRIVKDPITRSVTGVAGIVFVGAWGISEIAQRMGFEVDMVSSLLGMGVISLARVAAPLSYPIQSKVQHLSMRFSGQKKIFKPKSKFSSLLEKGWWGTQAFFSINAQFTVNKYERLRMEISIHLLEAYKAMKAGDHYLARVQLSELIDTANFVFPEFDLTEEQILLMVRPYFLYMNNLESLKADVLEQLAKNPKHLEDLPKFEDILDRWFASDEAS